MPTTTRATKRSIIAAAKRKWPAAQVQLREHPKAPIGGLRATIFDELIALSAHKKALEAAGAHRENADLNSTLARAAQFVVDVNGDPPSIPQLAVALGDYQHHQAQREDYQATSAGTWWPGKTRSRK